MTSTFMRTCILSEIFPNESHLKKKYKKITDKKPYTNTWNKHFYPYRVGLPFCSWSVQRKTSERYENFTTCMLQSVTVNGHGVILGFLIHFYNINSSTQRTLWKKLEVSIYEMLHKTRGSPFFAKPYRKH